VFDETHHIAANLSLLFLFEEMPFSSGDLPLSLLGFLFFPLLERRKNQAFYNDRCPLELPIFSAAKVISKD